MFTTFHDLTVAGFSENQALKLMALMVSSCDVFDGMPSQQVTMALHPSGQGEVTTDHIPDYPPDFGGTEGPSSN